MTDNGESGHNVAVNSPVPQGEGRIDRLPRVNLRMTVRQAHILRDVLQHDASVSRDVEVEFILSALSIALNSVPNARTVADISLAPACEFHTIRDMPDSAEHGE